MPGGPAGSTPIQRVPGPGGRVGAVQGQGSAWRGPNGGAGSGLLADDGEELAMTGVSSRVLFFAAGTLAGLG